MGLRYKELLKSKTRFLYLYEGDTYAFMGKFLSKDSKKEFFKAQMKFYNSIGEKTKDKKEHEKIFRKCLKGEDICYDLTMFGAFIERGLGKAEKLSEGYISRSMMDLWVRTQGLPPLREDEYSYRYIRSELEKVSRGSALMLDMIFKISNKLGKDTDWFYKKVGRISRNLAEVEGLYQFVQKDNNSIYLTAILFPEDKPALKEALEKEGAHLPTEDLGHLKHSASHSGYAVIDTLLTFKRKEKVKQLSLF